MESDLLVVEVVRSTGFLRKLEMTFIAFDANQPDLQSSRPGRDPGIVQPATPSTAEFDNRESLLSEFNRPQCGGPFCDISVPIRGDRNFLYGAGSITEDLRKEFGVDENAEKVCKHARRRLEAI